MERESDGNQSCERECGKEPSSFYGSIGVFQGDLIPLSSWSVMEVCVMSIVFYGCDSWIMSEELLRWLQSFQGEMGERILQLLAKWTSDTTTGVHGLAFNAGKFGPQD